MALTFDQRSLYKIRAWAGEYDQRVTFYSNTPTAADDGQLREGEVEKWSKWAMVRPARGQERIVGDQQVGDVTHIVRCRSDSETRTIEPSWWLKLPDGSTRLDVLRVYDLGQQQMEIELECRQRI